GLEAIPQSSRTHKVISDVKKWYTEDMVDGVADWRSTRRKLYDSYQGTQSNYRYYNWIESTVNTGATVLCLLYGEGDFKETAQIGVLAGWDCDCNPATAAGIIGVIEGYSGLPGELTDPAVCGDVYKNVYRPFLPDHSVTNPQYDTISNIASKIADLAGANIISRGGYITNEPEKTYHIPVSAAGLITDPEKPDPTGPSGLVGKALAAGMSVSPSASVENFNSNIDRSNLNAIIDGIKDNSYNGHKPYYTYVSNPALRPVEDYYQLNFSSEVSFSGVTFYEGDVDWKGINTYVRSDVLDGGFFEDIRVEILHEGNFISPANIQVSEPLDKHKMYQEITFTFEPTVGTAIRIIGTAGGTNSFTTIMELEADGDLIVNMEYLRVFAEHWMATTGALPLDINKDGIINMIDFADLASKWQNSNY
ncbi:MAG: ADP-ribosylglycohydrolase family protein, partial [Phycisphaerae bacterium]|nr:ADP-ribosylglycohydrolase family protein [Phycisphaerae bacterium]